MKTLKKIPTHWHIDSLRVLADATKFKEINIPGRYLIEKETGTILREFKMDALDVKYKHTTIYMLVHSWNLGKSSGSYFVLLISAKAAKNYFKGLQFSDIYDVYEFLIHNKFIKLHKEYSISDVLRTSKVKDVDFCRDEIWPDIHFRATEGASDKIQRDKHKEVVNYLTNLQNLYQVTPRGGIEEMTVGRGSKLYNKKRALMLQINRRQDSGYTHPFLKIYDKQLELIYHEQEYFRNSQNADIQNFIENNKILRYEFTLRDFDHFKHYDIDNYLPVIFSLKPEKIEAIYQDIYHKVFGNQQFTKARQVEEIAPTDLFILNLIIEIKSLYKKAYKDNGTNDDYDLLVESQVNRLVKNCAEKNQAYKKAAKRTQKKAKILLEIANNKQDVTTDTFKNSDFNL